MCYLETIIRFPRSWAFYLLFLFFFLLKRCLQPYFHCAQRIYSILAQPFEISWGLLYDLTTYGKHSVYVSEECVFCGYLVPYTIYFNEVKFIHYFIQTSISIPNFCLLLLFVIKVYALKSPTMVKMFYFSLVSNGYHGSHLLEYLPYLGK